MISFLQAQQLIAAHTISIAKETIDIEHALYKILAQDVFADRNYPPFNRAAMDGYAVNSQWYNALDHKRMPNQGVLLAGKEYTKKTDLSRCLRITTGAAVPDGLDAVIRVEDTHADCDMVTFTAAKELQTWANIAKEGEDIQKGELLLKKGILLNTQNLQALATVGQQTIEVAACPKIALITTGNEVKNIADKLLSFQIRNSNLWAIKTSLESKNIPLIYQNHCNDNEEEIQNAIAEALLVCDVLLLSGGVSMGEADFIPTCLIQNGIQEVFHKVAIKPGKPLWFGTNGKQAVFGLPGNPLSTFLDLHLFTLPYLSMIQGNAQNNFVKLVLANKQKNATIDRFIPFYIQDGLATTKEFNGSGDISALIGTDGFVFIPKEKEIQAGDLIDALWV